MDVIIYAQFIYILVVELESKQSEITSSPSKLQTIPVWGIYKGTSNDGKHRLGN